MRTHAQPLKNTPFLDVLLLFALALLTLSFIPPHLLLSDTQTVGGDTTEHYFVGRYYAHNHFPQG